MRAEYDSEADVIAVGIHPSSDEADQGHQVHPRAIVDKHDGRPVGVQLLYPGKGLDEPIAAVADAYELDAEELAAAAGSALAAPDRAVTVDVAARA